MDRYLSSKSYRYFFYLFILSIPLQTRKVFTTPHSFCTGSFTEYSSVFIYLSDILFIASCLSYLLFNRVEAKNTLYKLKSESGKAQRMVVFASILLLAFWYLISSVLNHSPFFEISIFRTFKMLEASALVIFIYLTFRDKRFFITSLFFLILAGIFQSFVAIYQFLFQHSLFNSPLLHKLTGETIISPNLPGIAKITTETGNLARAYGTLPHPNILGGFLLLSLFANLYLYLQYKHRLLSSNNRFDKTTLHKISLIWIFAFTIQMIALFFSFSRSAWIGCVIFIISFLLIRFIKTSIVSRETIQHTRFKYYHELICIIIIVISFCVLNFQLISNRLVQDVSANLSEQDILTNDTFRDRAFYNIVSRETIHRKPIFGSGPGTSIFQMDRYLQDNDIDYDLESWKYQPPHNIYILSTAETGIIGFMILLYIILMTILISTNEIVSRETKRQRVDLQNLSVALFLALLFIGSFDHYLVTMQQGLIIFWLTVGILLSQQDYNVSRETKSIGE